MLNAFISILIGYLLGSIPFGYVVAKCRGIDIRQHGSGNIGATNVFRTLGRPWGILVFALDVIKGIIAIRLVMELYSLNMSILAGLGCFLGHCYPIWLGFKGGKGVAVGAGILIGLSPWTAVIGLTIWGVSFKITRYVSLASLLAAFSLPIIVWFLQRQADAIFWFTLAISLIAIWRHRTNIQRLLAGTENRFEKKK